jgi:uncharacterized membrane protein
MAEELTRSLTMLAQRGVPRGAAQVLEDARRDSAPRDADLDSAPQRALRPAWVAVTAFSATLVVLGGSLAFGIVMRQPGLDVGSISEAVDEAAATTSGRWLLIPAVAVAVAIVALIVSKQQVRMHKENKMTTTIEKAPTERLEPPKRNNRWLIVTVVALTVALVALAAWVIYDQASEPETAASSEISALYNDYVASWRERDTEAFVNLTTEDYALHSFGTTTTRDEQANAIIATPGRLEVELIGDLVVMGDGPEYYVAAAEQVFFGGADYVGVSAYRVIDTDEGLKIAEHSWVGNL